MKGLFFLQPGTNSRDIFRDIILGFERAGCGVLILELAPLWRTIEASPDAQATVREIGRSVRALIERERPDFSMAMWANAVRTLPASVVGGEPRSFFDAIGLTHVQHWLDAPHWAHEGEMRGHFNTPIVAGERLLHVVNNPGTAREMTEVLGFGRTLACPYGINEELFRPTRPIGDAEFDLVFGIGPGDPKPTERALGELERDEPDVGAIRSEAANRVRAKLEQVLTGRSPCIARVAELLVESQLADPTRAVLDRLDGIASGSDELAEGVRALRADAGLFVTITEVVRRIETWERAFTIAYLSRHFRCATFGSGDLSAWGCRATHLGSLDYRDQTRAYARGRVGLNVMRWQDDVGSNIKPLEISASGRLCLMRRRRGLSGLLEEGREMELFDAPAEARARLRSLLDDPERLGAMAHAACERTRREHTWANRARAMLTWIESSERSAASRAVA